LKSSFNILVIDDNRVEREKGYEAVRAAGHRAVKAEDLHEALLFMDQLDEAGIVAGEAFSISEFRPQHVKWDGIITDVHYPDLMVKAPDSFVDPPPNGTAIVALCFRLSIPCVICTDVHHHHSQWIRNFGRQLSTPVVDDKNEAPDAWARSLTLLLPKIEQRRSQLAAGCMGTLGFGLS
jgi:hypothetical protein